MFTLFLWGSKMREGMREDSLETALPTTPLHPHTHWLGERYLLGISFIVMVTQVKMGIFNMLYSQELIELFDSTGSMYCGE
jgi:hypothetical protein